MFTLVKSQTQRQLTTAQLENLTASVHRAYLALDALARSPRETLHARYWRRSLIRRLHRLRPPAARAGAASLLATLVGQLLWDLTTALQEQCQERQMAAMVKAATDARYEADLAGAWDASQQLRDRLIEAEATVASLQAQHKADAEAIARLRRQLAEQRTQTNPPCLPAASQAAPFATPPGQQAEAAAGAVLPEVNSPVQQAILRAVARQAGVARTGDLAEQVALSAHLTAQQVRNAVLRLCERKLLAPEPAVATGALPQAVRLTALGASWCARTP